MTKHPTFRLWLLLPIMGMTVASSGAVFSESGDVRVTSTLQGTAESAWLEAAASPPVCPEPRRVTDTVREDTTWENWVPDPECFDYVVAADVQTNAQALTIEPGTVVGFEQGRGMRVRSGAALIAEGTAEHPIVLTGTTKERGFWKGLALEALTHGNNVLRHVTVEYTGGHGISNTQDASLILTGDVTMRIEHSTFRQSSGYGVSLDRGVTIEGAGDNAFTENALGPAWAYGTAVPSLRGATLTGNDVDVVTVSPNAITGPASWPAAVYHVLHTGPQSFTVQGGELTLAAGSELRFEGDQSMLVMQGGLSAVGTAQAPIVLTGTEQVRGHWGGLGLVGSDHEMNRLEHVVIEYGGGRTIGGMLGMANIVVTNGGAGEHTRLTIRNSELRNSGAYGLWARRDSDLTDFSGNTLTGNALGAAYVHAPVVDDLLTSNVFTGNDVDEVIVETGVGMVIDEPATWRDLGVPYHLQYPTGYSTEVVAALTIEPGVEMLMAPGLGISMRDGGSMSAIGAPNNRITMRAASEPWLGLDFLDTTGSFDHIDILDAGSAVWGGVLEPGTVTIRASYQAAVVHFTQDVTLAGNGYGVVFSYGESIAVGCPASVYVPERDQVADHCRAPAR